MKALHDGAQAQKAWRTSQLAALSDAVESIVRTTPEGLNELALLKDLQRPPWQLLGKIDFSTPAALYPVHFLVFHVLYSWRERLITEGKETLEINALSIRLRPLKTATGREAGFGDPLQDFYLDLNNYELSSETIDSMLNDFWRGIQRPPEGNLEAACKTLEMDCPPPDLRQAKSRFRRLAMHHHPDRGGSNHRLQELNRAMAVVKQYFRYQH